MPTNQTPNYQLSQWEKSDQVLMEDFNADNAKIDAALAAQASTLSAHTAQIARLGNCQIWTTTYKGTGFWGPDRPTSLTFPKKPVAALISNEFGFASWLLPEGLMAVFNGDKYFTNVAFALAPGLGSVGIVASMVTNEGIP
ncbi:MAG: hypothetical protein HFF44_07725, partial [Lawsonibacter sp.]|nr:hypothetical protein [Lawsonibacter sp.]